MATDPSSFGTRHGAKAERRARPSNHGVEWRRCVGVARAPTVSARVANGELAPGLVFFSLGQIRDERDCDIDEKMVGFSRQKVKSGSIRFYPGEVTLGSDEVVGARRTGGGRYVLCWWEVIHTVALTDIYPERTYRIIASGGATYRHRYVAPPDAGGGM